MTSKIIKTILFVLFVFGVIFFVDYCSFIIKLI